MNKPEAAGRMIQWTIELSQFDIEYHPRIAIKAQALADFITEFTFPDEDSLTDEVDAVELVKKCDKCQRYGNVQRLLAERLTTIASSWPFAQWGIDIVDPLPQGKGQANGQTEVTNQTLLKIIKAKLDDTKGAWPEELPNVLWAYRTIARTPTGETPFRLTNGTEAVIPIEVGVTSIRREVFNEEGNDDQLRLNLDCLDEIRDKASSRMTRYQQKMAEYYNRRVKLRRLDIGDLVLHKVTTATKDPAQGKLGPN
ncbi:uncharacterized protein LOC115970549 [Quercus lobata]|uniref:uncharacterized protein LOC115970549 n=1 Tax=Quercus lobata TaxID=97700 RepID=UPI001245CFA0|nr:uncharacterized protein LOC115970549 [Quercus lobata]